MKYTISADGVATWLSLCGGTNSHFSGRLMQRAEQDRTRSRHCPYCGAFLGARREKLIDTGIEGYRCKRCMQ